MKQEHKKVLIDMNISSFEVPPVKDLLLIGKDAPIGMNAAKQMVDSLSPDKFIVIELKDDIVEAIVVKKELLKLLPKKTLIDTVLSETSNFMDKTMVLRIDLDITYSIKKILDI